MASSGRSPAAAVSARTASGAAAGRGRGRGRRDGRGGPLALAGHGHVAGGHGRGAAPGRGEQPVDLVVHGVGRREPLGGVLAQRAADQRVDGRAERPVDRRGRRRRLPHVLVGHPQRRVRVERRPSGEQFEEQAADGVQVGALVQAAAQGLFGGEVLRGADHHAGLRHGGDAGLHGAGDAEVHHLHHTAAGDHHVAGLDVAVHQARLVAGRERGQHVPGDLQRPVGGHGPVPGDVRGQDVAQRPPLDVLHDDVRHRAAVEVVLAGVEDRDDVGVVELGHGLRLAAEALAEGLLGAQVGVQGLDGDGAVQHRVVRQVDRGHAALTEQAAQQVATATDRAPRVPALCGVPTHRNRYPLKVLRGGTHDPRVRPPSLAHRLGASSSSTVPSPDAHRARTHGGDVRVRGAGRAGTAGRPGGAEGVPGGPGCGSPLFGVGKSGTVAHRRRGVGQET